MTRPDQFNCMDFRREKLADPQRISAAARAHEGSCPLCQAFARRIDNNEARIARVLQVPTPDGLSDRVIMGVTHGRAQPWRLFALAATVVMSFGVGLQLWREGPQHEYARFAIEHVMHEPESFTEHRLADPAEFRYVLARFGAELEAPVGKVRYMKLCPVPEGTGWHIVIDTPKGMVTLLLVPGQKPGGQHLDASMHGSVAKAVPAGQGYYALVADSQQTLDAAADMFKTRLRWTA
jgi:hypothetical protein